MKKILFIGVVLVMISAVIMPAAVLANGSVAVGDITDILEGEIKKAGNSGRWVVQGREVEIDFSGILSGPYTLSYHANVDLDSQAGNLQGMLSEDEGDNVLNVTGTTSPAIPTGYFDNIGGLDVQLHIINIDGRWAFTNGDIGNGTFVGVIYAVICEEDYGIGELYYGYDLDGHVVGVATGSHIILYD